MFPNQEVGDGSSLEHLVCPAQFENGFSYEHFRKLTENRYNESLESCIVAQQV